ncbi:MAG TPA: L-serine ammonia-lyase, iron-sulfur-dependent, subunit alpha [Clostridiaceae bacterium]
MFKNTAKEVIEECNKENIHLWEYTLKEEVIRSGLPEKEITDRMRRNLQVMKVASEYGRYHKVKSVSGLIGGDAFRLQKYLDKGESLTGNFIIKAMARSLSCSEVNASMGKIVASPTAGSCGILPAVILTVGEKLNKSEAELIQALFTASGVGILIAKNASLSGAEGGCMAECGSAAAMGAASVVEMMGGTPEMCFDAASIVIKNVLGLVCDPVAGLVEVPCAKRNISGTVSALTIADLVMAGVKSVIPFDDSVLAMNSIGKSMACELKETAMGGLAVTPTARKIKDSLL